MIDLTAHIKDPNAHHRPTAAMEVFDSGWLLNEMGGAGVADWATVHLGNDPTDSTDTLTHNLNAPLSDLLVKIFISTNGTDANSFEVPYVGDTSKRGYTIYQIDSNTLKIQTSSSNPSYVEDNGDITALSNWYYKIKVWKLG